MLRWSTSLHKWIALIVGIQVLGWVLGGLVMTAMPIEQVRGEHRLSHNQPLPLDAAKVLSLAEVLARAELDEISGANLKSTPAGPVWFLTTRYGGEAWYDAITGENIDEITEDEARAAAVQAYAGEAAPVRVTRHDEPPMEAGTSSLVYAVEFGDPERTTFYVSGYTGEFISARSNAWRFYNFFYMVHLMDFSGAANYNHPVIVIATALTLVIVLTGFVLLWSRLARDLVRARRARKAGADTPS